TRYSDLAGTTVVGTTVYTRDEDGRETNLTNLDGAGGVLANYTYTYDAADRLTEKIEDGTSTTYSYDLASQLTQDGASTFDYDATGNRTNTGYATDPGNRITTDGVWTYTFDAEGNHTKKSKGTSAETWVYAYDNRNQMISAGDSATDGGVATQQVTYVYDALGNRIENDSWDGSTTTVQRYGMDGWDPAKPSPVGNENFDTWVQLDGSNALVRRRVTGVEANEQIARQTAGGVVNWYLTDNQGSVRKVIDNSGSVQATSTFDAYGNLVAGSLTDRFGFQGMEFDTVTSDYFDRARVYDPSIGRFLGEDVKFPGTGSNAFEYAGNAPTNASDPSGQAVFTQSRQDAQRLIDELVNFGGHRDWFSITELPNGLYYVHTDDRSVDELFKWAARLKTDVSGTFTPLPVQPRELFLGASGAFGEVNAQNTNVLVGFPKKGPPEVSSYSPTGFSSLVAWSERQSFLSQRLHPGWGVALDLGGTGYHFGEGVISVNPSRKTFVPIIRSKDLRAQSDVDVDPSTGAGASCPRWIFGNAFNLSTQQYKDPEGVRKVLPPGPFAPMSIDTIYIEESIAIFKNDPSFKHGVLTILKPGGKIIVSEPNIKLSAEIHKLLIAQLAEMYDIPLAEATKRVVLTLPANTKQGTPIKLQKGFKVVMDKTVPQNLFTFSFQIFPPIDPKVPIAPPPH
ncbi:MAG: hypothetical protein K8U57_33795, partial [Planctomycetes bacterium]|nr:hypothetical protein [Planctomycetota bacterium]